MSSMDVSTTSNDGADRGCADGIVTSPNRLSSVLCLSHSGAGSLQPRVEQIAQPVAEQIDAEHGEEDAQTGKQLQPPRRADIGAAVGQPAAPGRNFRRDP